MCVCALHLDCASRLRTSTTHLGGVSAASRRGRCLYRKMDGLTLDDDPKAAKDKLELRTIETKGFSMEGADKKSSN